METGELSYNARTFVFKRSAIKRALMLNESMSNRKVAGRTYAVRKR
jgi:hypothetical protein